MVVCKMFNKVSGKICAVVMSILAIVSPSVVSANIGVRVLEAQGATLEADYVQLIAYDGSATIAGRLLGYDDQTYHIETNLGVLRIAEKWVRCEGVLCPRLDASPELARIN